jgi:hypothetical protein
MPTIAAGSSLKAMLGIGHPPVRVAPAHPVDEDEVLTELMTASDRLRSRLDSGSLSRTELIALAVDLEPVAHVLLQLRQLYDRANAGGGSTRARAHAVRLVDTALYGIDEVLYYTRPWRPYAWPDALQAKLRNAQNSLAQAIVALRWARISG